MLVYSINGQVPKKPCGSVAHNPRHHPPLALVSWLRESLAHPAFCSSASAPTPSLEVAYEPNVFASAYVLLRACDKFFDLAGRYPGQVMGKDSSSVVGSQADTAQLESDVDDLRRMASSMVGDLLAREGGGSGGIGNASSVVSHATGSFLKPHGGAGMGSIPAVSEEVMQEMVRSGGREIHVVAAMMGSLASQEAIKLVVEQYIPVEGVVVYCGITNTSQCLPLR